MYSYGVRKKKKGDFGLGARVSNSRYKYRIAIGQLDDEAEDNVQLVEMFKDKLFFFGAQEWVNFFQIQTNTVTVPTEAMRRGDFSELLNPRALKFVS